MSESKSTPVNQVQENKNELQLMKAQIQQRASIAMKDSSKARIDPNEQRALEMQQLFTEKFANPGELDLNMIDALTNLLSVTMGDTEDEQNQLMKARLSQLEDFGKSKGIDVQTLQKSRITQIKLQHVQMSMLRDALGRNISGYANALGRTEWWRKFVEALLAKMASGTMNPKYLHRKMFWTGIRSTDFPLHNHWLGMQVFMNAALAMATIKADANWTEEGVLGHWDPNTATVPISNTIGATPTSKATYYYEQGIAHMMARKINLTSLVNQSVPFHPLIIRFMPEFRNAVLPDFQDSPASKEYTRLVNVVLTIHKMMLNFSIPETGRLTGYFKGLRERIIMSQRMAQEAGGVTVGREGALVRIDSEVGSVLQKAKALTLRANRPETKRNPRGRLMIPITEGMDLSSLIPAEMQKAFKELSDVDLSELTVNDPLDEAIKEGAMAPGSNWATQDDITQKAIILGKAIPYARRVRMNKDEARDVWELIKEHGGIPLVDFYMSPDKKVFTFLLKGEPDDKIPEDYSGLRGQNNITKELE